MVNINALVGKTIDVSQYPLLRLAIPDQTLQIEEIFPVSEVEAILESFAPYIAEYSIKPFGEIYGNTILCLGTSEENRGKVYYFDFDFGCFELAPSLGDFIHRLK